MRNKRTVIRQLLWVTCVLGGTVFAAAAVHAKGEYGILKKGRGQTMTRVKDISYRAVNDSYRVTTMDGVVYQVPRKDVAQLRIPTPHNFKNFADVLKSNTPTQTAMQGMEQIVKQYVHRVWDREGLKRLIPVYLDRNENSKVIRACERVKKAAGIVPEEIQGSYWTALRRDGKEARVLREIGETIEKGSRPAQAAAHMVRGDIYFDKGKLSEAFVEGYVRVVILFGDIKSLQPEALYKTYTTLKALRDARAERFRGKLLEQFPQSKYAQQLGV